ncbi:MAG: glycoside hydrolase family 13 protein [Oscillospiraceae bacterium]|jgi:glycosidase|nr:glycoside hydrolase family 13 protein [Oscillospiraceae bacterium]
MSFYDARDSAYKDPFGAVTAGTDVSLSIRVPRAQAVSHAFLCVSFEFDRESAEILMDWCGLDRDEDVYRAVLPTTGRLGPVWYRFRVERFDRSDLHIGVNTETMDGKGISSEEILPPFQLTVYDEALFVPDWYGRGITYHIFPDRFRRTDVPDPAGLVGRRVVHEDWDDVPDFKPDEHGEIHNRDFFGGSLAGVREKLPYLASLGVTTLYFSPIFEAASNHRYDTADYKRVDPMFGSTEAFSELCRAARALDIRVMLDGVFNHTGFDSRYFNGRGTYDEVGAFQSKESPYYNWYDFQEWPHRYASWWGIYTLPQVNESNSDYLKYIIEDDDSVIRHWLRAGASAWRLDVADELPDDFLVRLRAAARAEAADAVIIGEVWEDASHKTAYGVRRRYLLGHELDGVMNYPFRNALLGYLLGGDAVRFRCEMETLRENYPAPVFYSLMNIVGTHDTPRALTVLGVDESLYGRPREERAAYTLPPERYARACARLKLASLIQYAFPGSPCVYYGDEAGMEGFEDPFNRRGFPWDREDASLTSWYTALGACRRRHEALQSGALSYLQAEGPLLAFARTAPGEYLAAVTNRAETACPCSLPWPAAAARDLLSGEVFTARDGVVSPAMGPLRGRLLLAEPGAAGGRSG